MLNACACEIALEKGRCHKQISQNGWDLNVFVGNNLVACTPNVGTWRTLKKVWSLEP